MNPQVAVSVNAPLTPLTYFREVASMFWIHVRELVVALVLVVGVGLTALLTRSLLQLRAFGPGEVLFIFLTPVGAVLLFEALVAGWRLYRRQQNALTTIRSLLDLNNADRDDVEEHLRARDRSRSTAS